MSGASGITTRECVRLSRMAEDARAQAITVLTPMFISPSEEELYKHFRTIAESTAFANADLQQPGPDRD